MLIDDEAVTVNEEEAEGAGGGGGWSLSCCSSLPSYAPTSSCTAVPICTSRRASGTPCGPSFMMAFTVVCSASTASVSGVSSRRNGPNVPDARTQTQTTRQPGNHQHITIS